MPITESSITLDFPDANYFRFEDCQGYKKLQNHFSEMDVCWYEQATDTLYIIELKNWQNNTLEEENDSTYSAQKIQEMKTNISKHRINNLFKKSIDSVIMFMSILLGKPAGIEIQNCSPFVITNNTKIKLLSIINWTDPDVSYIATVNSEYKSRFMSYSKLFGVQTFLVLTKDQAASQFNWIR